MAGVLAEDELERAYRRADLVVAPSRVESYGMAIADALRRGIPVVASGVGGIPQTVAAGAQRCSCHRSRTRWAEALRRWMADPALRARLKDEARRGRASLPRWSDTADRVADAGGCAMSVADPAVQPAIAPVALVSPGLSAYAPAVGVPLLVIVVACATGVVAARTTRRAPRLVAP